MTDVYFRIEWINVHDCWMEIWLIEKGSEFTKQKIISNSVHKFVIGYYIWTFKSGLSYIKIHFSKPNTIIPIQVCVYKNSLFLRIFSLLNCHAIVHAIAWFLVGFSLAYTSKLPICLSNNNQKFSSKGAAPADVQPAFLLDWGFSI